ncbi:MAG: acylphosphatase [Mariniblastus sp.]
MADKKYEILFSGQVQGVGFRHTAKNVSRNYDLVGTVQNLRDGRVKMVLEGDSETIERFIAEVSESTYGNVRETEITQSLPTGQFASFDVIR